MPRAWIVGAALLLLACKRDQGAAPSRLRLGLFPNMTHAAGLVGVDRGDFARALGGVTLETKAFNAGPEAMEALFAGALDASYVGPGPALNAFMRSHGEALMVVAGAASGGAGLVVREGAQIAGPDGLHGKRIATPQLGNTQDIALRVFLDRHGLKPKELGGDVQVIPISNPDILQLMRSGQLDGAWVPEPWLTRLVHEAGGKLLVDERDLWPERRFPTALLVVAKKWAAARPELVQTLVAAHVQIVEWIRAHPDEARAIVAEALKQRGQKPLPPEQLAEAWSRLEIVADPLEPALHKLAGDAAKLGYLPKGGDARSLVDRRWLDAASGGGGG